MGEVEFRAYRAGDLGALFALDEACFGAEFRFDLKTMRRLAEDPGGLVRIAEVAGELVGFVIAHCEVGGTGYLDTLDVSERWRRGGLGGRLLTAAEDWAREQGGAEMRLHVHTGNAGALGLYERAGYVPIGVQRRFYGRGLDAMVLSKRLRVD